MRIVRAKYGKRDTPKEMREYQINGVGPVGTFEEFKENFPNEIFEIEDPISKEYDEEMERVWAEVKADKIREENIEHYEDYED